MHGGAAYFAASAATAAHRDSSTAVFDAEGEGPTLHRGGRLRSSAWLSRYGQRERLGGTLVLQRLVVVAALAAAFIILKCASHLGGGRAPGWFRRSLAAQGGYTVEVACGGSERPALRVESGVGISEYETQCATYGRINSVFNLLEQLQRICGELIDGRGILLQTRIASFYLIVSSQELAAVSGMLPNTLEMRRLQLTNSGSAMANAILNQFPLCEYGGNACRRIRRLIGLNELLRSLPNTCTLGIKQCMARLQHLGIVQMVFLTSTVTLLKGLLDSPEHRRRPSDKAVADMLTAMTSLRHQRRSQIFSDHSLGPWVAHYLAMGTPQSVVQRERQRQILLNNDLTPVGVLVTQLREEAERVMDALRRATGQLATARTSGHPASAESAQRTWPRTASGDQMIPIPTPRSNGTYTPGSSPSVVQDSGFSRGQALGLSVTLDRGHPLLRQPPLHPVPEEPPFRLTDNSVQNTSWHRSGTPSAKVPIFGVSTHHNSKVGEVPAGLPGLPPVGFLGGNQVPAALQAVGPAGVPHVQPSNTRREIPRRQSRERARATPFYGVALGEPRPSGSKEPQRR